MFGKRLGIGTGVATVLAASVVAIGAGTVIAGSAEPPAWQKGLQARSEALNQHYGLGDYASTALSTSGAPSAPDSDWLRALRLRSEAMNRLYGLGSAGDKVTVRFVTRTSNGGDISDGGVAGTSDLSPGRSRTRQGRRLPHAERCADHASLRQHREEGRAHVRRQDRREPRNIALDDRLRHQGLQGSARQGHRARECRLHGRSTLTGTVSR